MVSPPPERVCIHTYRKKECAYVVCVLVCLYMGCGMCGKTWPQQQPKARDAIA